MKKLSIIKYFLGFAILAYASITFALDLTVESSKKRLFVFNENKFDFVVEKLQTNKPLEVSTAYMSFDTPENALMSVLATMKRGDVDTFKSLNDPNRVTRMESSMKAFNMDFNSIAKTWENSFKQNFYISHRIRYKKYVMFVMQRAKKGEPFVSNEDEVTLLKSDLFAMENIGGKWRLSDGPKNDPVFCCWYTRDGKPEITLK